MKDQDDQSSNGQPVRKPKSLLAVDAERGGAHGHVRQRVDTSECAVPPTALARDHDGDESHNAHDSVCPAHQREIQFEYRILLRSADSGSYPRARRACWIRRSRCARCCDRARFPLAVSAYHVTGRRSWNSLRATT
jgi:hypothetical protein